MSIIKLAEDLGLKVERRPVAVDELETFEEVGACGTAAIISPIGEINDLETGKIYKFCKDGKPGSVSKKLYDTLVGIQYGEVEDKYGWTTFVD
jgi:branched-chain amino acid aminotransferase